MPKLTDYARKGFQRRRPPWKRVELPEWWDVAVWVAGGGVVAVIVLSAVLNGGGASGTVPGDAGARPYPVQTLGSRLTDGPGAVPSGDLPAPPSSSTAAAAPAPAGPVGKPVKDFTATAAVRIPVTGGGTTVVPVGARNVALAAAIATTTGDWSGIPFTGPGRPTVSASRHGLGGSVARLTVADPAVTGNSAYRFSATIDDAGGAEPSAVPITVERNESGYAIRYG
ncbi:hypothetical protein [Actinomadura chokoriensis]|uniref:hypothetical protein n=1 Tax=Actinomadura chokoriensis TaxID=454156 RepID=UPI0031F8C625